MTTDGYFDDEALAANRSRGALQTMARRQLRVSLAVAVALLLLAGLTAASAPHESISQMAAWLKTF